MYRNTIEIQKSLENYLNLPNFNFERKMEPASVMDVDQDVEYHGPEQRRSNDTLTKKMKTRKANDRIHFSICKLR